LPSPPPIIPSHRPPPIQQHSQERERTWLNVAAAPLHRSCPPPLLIESIFRSGTVTEEAHVYRSHHSLSLSHALFFFAMSSSNPGFSNRLRLGFKKTQHPPSPPPNQLVQQQQQGQQQPVQQGQPRMGPQRPPSYPPPYAGPPTGAPHLVQQGRAQSPMPPHGGAPYGPTQVGGIPPQMSNQMMGPPQPYGQPPGYPMQPQHRTSTGQQSPMGGGMRPSVSEMETNNRSKAQLIVGIDFVSFPPSFFSLAGSKRKKEVLGLEDCEMVGC